MKHIFSFEAEIYARIVDATSGRNQTYKERSHRSIFKQLLDSVLPKKERTIDRMQHESINLVAAGIHTTKWVLSVAMVQLLLYPNMLQKLKNELCEAWPDVDVPLKLQQLEQLPYLTAVIQEGKNSFHKYIHIGCSYVDNSDGNTAFRLSYGIPSRLARTSKYPLQYKPYTIPPGTPFSMSIFYMHTNPTIFPSLYKFDPSRWLPVNGILPTGPDGKKLLTRYLVALGRGDKHCIGMNLANAEIYIGLANLIRKCNFDLHQTTERDVGFYSENFIPRPLSPCPMDLALIIKLNDLSRTPQGGISTQSSVRLLCDLHSIAACLL
jgi:cytochrome P450